MKCHLEISVPEESPNSTVNFEVESLDQKIALETLLEFVKWLKEKEEGTKP